MPVRLGSRAKYGAKRCDRHVPSHASLKECRRHEELLLLERAGQIRHLKSQVPFTLAPPVVIDGRRRPALRYIADWTYEEQKDGGRWGFVIEDCKGMTTPVFQVKRHLMAVHGLDIRLT